MFKSATPVYGISWFWFVSPSETSCYRVQSMTWKWWMFMVWCSWLTHIPLTEVGCAGGRFLSRNTSFTFVARPRSWRGCTMYLHMLAQGRRVRITLVTTSHFAGIRFVTSVYVGMLLSVRAIGEASVTTLKFALERLFTYKNEKDKIR